MLVVVAVAVALVAIIAVCIVLRLEEPLSRRKLETTTQVVGGTHYIRTPPHFIAYNQAIVIYGDIPSNANYWGVTGYSESSDHPIGNTIKRESSDYGPGIAVVLTTSISLYERVKRDIREVWSSRFPIHVKPLFVPADMIKYRQSLTLTVVPRDGKVPRWKALLYTSPDTRYSAYREEVVRTKPSSFPNERDKYSCENWSEVCETIVSDRDYTIRREIRVEEGDLRPINWDITSFKAEFELDDEEDVIVLAVNHVSSLRGIYSSVDISADEVRSITTGSREDEIRRFSLQSKVIHHQGSKGKVVIIERIYAEPRTTVGPDPDSIVPMKIYVVDKK